MVSGPPKPAKPRTTPASRAAGINTAKNEAVNCIPACCRKYAGTARPAMLPRGAGLLCADRRFSLSPRCAARDACAPRREVGGNLPEELLELVDHRLRALPRPGSGRLAARRRSPRLRNIAARCRAARTTPGSCPCRPTAPASGIVPCARRRGSRGRAPGRCRWRRGSPRTCRGSWRDRARQPCSRPARQGGRSPPTSARARCVR